MAVTRTSAGKARCASKHTPPPSATHQEEDLVHFVIGSVTKDRESQPPPPKPAQTALSLLMVGEYAQLPQLLGNRPPSDFTVPPARCPRLERPETSPAMRRGSRLRPTGPTTVRAREAQVAVSPSAFLGKYMSRTIFRTAGKERAGDRSCCG